MSRAIINKHIDNFEQLSKTLFVNDSDKAKGEIIICNDENNPSIYIISTNGNITKISGGGSGGNGSYDDTELRTLIISNTNSIKNIKVNENGESVINGSITVAGLDDKLGAGNYSNGDVISGGTSIQKILENILSKELYPTVSVNRANASVSMSDLTLVLNKTDDTVEVGTLISLTSANTNGCTVSTTPSSINNLLYGYSFNLTGGTIISENSIKSDCSASILNNEYEIRAYLTGFTADNNNYVQTIPGNSLSENNASLGTSNLGCAIEGTNKIEIKANGPTYTYSANAINKIYYCSNLGNRDEQHTKEVEKVSGTTDSVSKNKSKTITGKYKYFVGYSDNTSYEQFDTDSIRNLTVISDWINVNSTTTIVPSSDIKSTNGKSLVIACPSKYKLNSIKYSNNADMLPNFTSIGEVDVNTGEIKTKYTVYVYPVTNNAVIEYTSVTLSKK